nr:hypothetical protein [Maliibacterium massiliense]
MGQVQKGLKSHCACPACGYTCAACMGNDSVPLPKPIKPTIAQEGDFAPIDFEDEID